MNGKIGAEHLGRRAVVYVRQSSVTQLQENHESRRRQYGLADRARELGFSEVLVIDDDLGLSGSGSVARPGFARLVGEVCSGMVGAILCIEASRLARNGRDWHHLLELCGLSRTVLVDPEGVYDPCLSNDRLLLGLKGTMSEFELTLLRGRSLDAIRSKASRGELRFELPIGLCWVRGDRIELEPDQRIQQSVRTVFAKFDEFGSIRQVHLWLRREGVTMPVVSHGEVGRQVEWKLPVYNAIHGILTNPLYAGAYAWGKSETRVKLEDGRPRKGQGHRKPRENWSVLLKDHHPGYIDWPHFERNQRTIAENARMKQKMSRRTAGGGRSLLAGLLRCRRCGRMLHVTYGNKGEMPRYGCRGANINHGTAMCISFGGSRPDQAVERELLRALEAPAIEAALTAAERASGEHDEQRKALDLELEQARYEARLAGRRYEAVDPDNRLVASELEVRWNAALQHVSTVEQRRAGLEAARSTQQSPNRAELLKLAQDLPAVWHSPTSDMALKQRIVRMLLEEIVVDVDADKSEIVMTLHWVGGRHSELRVVKNKTGHHSRCTDQTAIDVVRSMAGRWTDQQIASTLNRLGKRTGAGNTWNQQRIRALRSHHDLPPYTAQEVCTTVTLQQAAQRLGVSYPVVRRLLRQGVLPASQVTPSAPWEVPVDALASETVQAAVATAQVRTRPSRKNDRGEIPLFPNL